MKHLFTFIFILLSFSFSHAQKIDISKHFGGIHYHIEGRRIPPREAFRRISVNPGAKRIYQSVQLKKSIGSLFFFSGGVFTGFNIARALSPPAVRKRINGTFMAAGIGLIALSVPLHTSYRRKAEKAIGVYNDGLPYSSEVHFPVLINLSLDEQGLGLAVTF